MTEPPKPTPTDRMAKARAKSKQPLGIARLKLAHARRAVERVERVYKEQSVAQRKRVERCQADVDHLLRLERIDAGKPEPEAVDSTTDDTADGK